MDSCRFQGDTELGVCRNSGVRYGATHVNASVPSSGSGFKIAGRSPRKKNFSSAQLHIATIFPPCLCALILALLHYSSLRGPYAFLDSSLPSHSCAMLRHTQRKSVPQADAATTVQEWFMTTIEVASYPTLHGCAASGTSPVSSHLEVCS
jgi:hypothetical protein